MTGCYKVDTELSIQKSCSLDALDNISLYEGDKISAYGDTDLGKSTSTDDCTEYSPYQSRDQKSLPSRVLGRCLSSARNFVAGFEQSINRLSSSLSGVATGKPLADRSFSTDTLDASFTKKSDESHFIDDGLPLYDDIYPVPGYDEVIAWGEAMRRGKTQFDLATYMAGGVSIYSPDGLDDGAGGYFSMDFSRTLYFALRESHCSSTILKFAQSDLFDEVAGDMKKLHPKLRAEFEQFLLDLLHDESHKDVFASGKEEESGLCHSKYKNEVTKNFTQSQQYKDAEYKSSYDVYLKGCYGRYSVPAKSILIKQVEGLYPVYSQYVRDIKRSEGLESFDLAPYTSGRLSIYPPSGLARSEDQFSRDFSRALFFSLRSGSLSDSTLKFLDSDVFDYVFSNRSELPIAGREALMRNVLDRLMHQRKYGTDKTQENTFPTVKDTKHLFLRKFQNITRLMFKNS